MKWNKKQVLCLVAVLVVTAIAIGGIALWLRESKLQQLQNEALAELERNVGRYDEQSIVLRQTSRARAEELADLYGATLRITKDGRFATLTLPEGTTIRDVYAREESRRYIGEMEADYQVSISELTETEEDGQRLPQRPIYGAGDADYAKQTYLDYVNLDRTWYSYTGAGMTVAVIDTGIDTDHPEFAGRISEYSYNATEDKIVKDYSDWSLIEDEQGHGTAVTGVIAASMNSGNVVGIAPDAQILVIKAECDAYGSFRTSDLVFGIYYAIERDVNVINMSFGTYLPVNPFAEALQLAYDSDIICVAAAGNDNTATRSWPAADEHVIAVGALDGWERAYYSNVGENVDVMAPGTTYTTKMGGGYGDMTGTSLASPIVAGAMALLAQRNPYTNFEEVTEQLYAACYDLGPLGRDWHYGFGALDVGALMLEERGKITYDMLTDELENIEGLYIQGHTLQQLPEPERLYAVFDGWYYDDTFTQEYNYYTDKFYGEEITLYAKWVNEEDGIPYTYVILDDGTVEIRSYTGHRRYITIPEKIEGRIVSSIGEMAFAGQTRLREVTLPSGLKHIGIYAFQNCTNLVGIQIPENVTEIGEGAFAGNIRLSTVAFTGNSKLETIGYAAFSDCGSLQWIELPASLQNVDGAAFSGTTQLYHIGVQQGNTAFQSKDGVLFDISGSTLVAFPAAWGSSYTLPAETTRIGPYAFAYAKIKTVDLSNVTTIGDYGFVCAELERVDIPDGMRELGDRVFMMNGKLSAVTFGRGLTEISPEAFYGCASLQQVTIPNNICMLGTGAFGATGLKEVIFEENSSLTLIGGGAFIGTKLEQIDIPASVQVIGAMAFKSTSLQQVNFAPDSVLQDIGGEAFQGCWSLQSIRLPESLKSIGESAFQSSGLTEVTIPAGVIYLGDGAFSLCSNLTAVSIAEGNTSYHDIDGVVYDLSNTTIHIYPANRAGENYVLESTTQIVAPWAFAGAMNLTYVQLPESLTQIGTYGFSSCAQLDNVYIPDNVVQIGQYAFAYSWNMYNVYFNETAKIFRLGFGAFAYSGIANFRVPANVSTMAQQVFEGCSNLSSITFAAGSKLESISAYMFDGCSNLYSVVFEPGSALQSIQAHGFEGMEQLQHVVFNDAKITNIDNFAFRFCKNLTELQLPETVTNIGRYAFYGCTNLSELRIPAAVEHIGSYAFLNTKDMELYFAGEALPAYLDENWDYATKGYYTGVETVEQNGDYKYAILPSGAIAILQYLGSETHVDLTQVDLGGPITTIGGSAFEDSTVKTIVLPETLTAIQAEAFRYTALEGVHIPAGVTFIGREAFAYTDIQSLTFAENAKIAVIEQHAFEETRGLTTVMLPASVTTLGTGVFQGSGLQSVIFAPGSQLAEIPQRAFAATELTAVTLPDSVTLVNHDAFANVQTLKSVTFGNNDGIRLMSNAFYNTGISSLHIPANVTYIGEYCFVGLQQLTAFTVDENNPNYKAEDGLLLTKNGRKLIAVPAGREGSLIVPLSVEEIGFGAFEASKLSQIQFHGDANILSFGYRAFFKASNITTITIPKSVVAIDYYAFAYCESLKEVIFAEGNQLKGIYEGAFCGDLNLESIILPADVVEISDFAFYGCSKLTTLPLSAPENLKGIYDYAFAYSGLEGQLTMPENLYDIGSYAFLGCKVTEVTVSDTNKKDLIIGIGAFENCNQLTEITLPFIGAEYEDEWKTWFGYIFGAGSYTANNTYVPKSLKTVTITEGISFIGWGAFSGCTELEEINLPHSVSDICSESFREVVARYELTNTISVYLGSGGYREPYGFFSGGVGGTGLSGHVKLAEGVKYVSLDCPGVTAITLPEGVTTVEMANASITEIYLPDSVAEFRFNNLLKLQSVRLPATMKTIPSSSFFGCESLQKVVLPEELEVIGGGAFSGCAALNSVVLPESVTTIGAFAFNGCKALSSIQLPKNLQTIEEYAFADCTKLYEIINHSQLALTFGGEDNGQVAFNARWIIDQNGNKTTLIEGSDATYVDTAEGYRFLLENGEYSLVAYLGSEETLTLPLDILGNPYTIRQFRGGKHIIIPEGITAIDDYAFAGHGQLESIVIADSVTKIGEFAFSQCAKLQSVQLPMGLTTVEAHLFWECTSLQAVEIPANVTEIGYGAFIDCIALQQVTLPDGLQTIGDNVFRGTAVTSIKIPASLRDIVSGAFAGCPLETIEVDARNQNFVQVDNILYNKDMTVIYAAAYNITHVVIPASVQDIGSAFSGCTKLHTVEFAAGSQLTQLPYRAFADCSALEQIIWPDNLQSIAYAAFYGCSALKTVRLPDTLTYLESEAFWNCAGLTELYLPAGVSNFWPGSVWECSNLQAIHVDPANESYCSVDGVVYTKDMSQIVLVAAGMTGTVTIPEGITHISGFESSSVTEVILPESAVSIEPYAFDRCRSLKKIYIPDSVTSIGFGAFWDCVALEEVRLPYGLTEIAEYAFYGCESLQQVTIPDSVMVVHDNAFQNCYGLKDLTLSKQLTEIGDYAFYSCNIRYLDIPEGVVSIGSEAFAYCDDLLWITLPQSLQHIGQDAFYYNIKLHEIRNNGDLPLVCGSDSYGGVAQYALAIVDKNGNRTLLDPEKLFAVIETEDGFVFTQENDVYTMIAYWGEQETVTLPLTFNGSPYEMYAVDGIRHAIIPEGWTEVPTMAFWSSSTLEYVTIPNTVTTISHGAFGYCVNLKEVTIPDSVMIIDNSAFDYCQSLASISVGPNVTFIGFGAFRDTAFAKDPANWSDGALYLNRYLLDVDKTLSSFTVRPDTLTICDSAFFQCYLLKILETGVCKTNVLQECVNLETLILTRNNGELGSFIPITLKNIVLTESFLWNEESKWLFEFVNGATIFVESKDADLRWDVNYPNWNLGLPVIYGDQWIWANFYDADGQLIQSAPQRNAAVIRLPYLAEKPGYAFVGWDLDGDGVADSVPATSAVDIYAYMLMERVCEHSYQSVVTEPTCTEDGNATYTCSICGDSYSERIPAAGHKVVIDEAVAPTCTETGLTEGSHCETCGEVLVVQQILDAIGHQYSSSVTKPTCTEDGDTTYTCDVCGDSHSEGIPATGHKVVIDEAVAPTCVETGLTEGSHCETCGEVLVAQQILDAIGHQYSSVVTEPTCTESGYTTHSCGNCGATYTDNHVDALGHSWDEGVVTIAPTLESEGEKRYTCTCCGETRTEILPKKEPVIYDTPADNTVQIPENDCFEGGTTVTVQLIEEGKNFETVSAAMEFVAEQYVAYQFTAAKDGVQVQPSGKLAVTIAIPESYSNNVVVYYMDENGKLEKLESRVDVDARTVTVELTHFSTYILADADTAPTFVLGDVNDDGRINARDARLLLRFIADLVEESELVVAAADFNGDGRINARDARDVLRHIAGLD